jgi:FixJ family two-component response regulator
LACETLARLTRREREVFERLIVGNSNKAIARMLDIAPAPWKFIALGS